MITVGGYLIDVAHTETHDLPSEVTQFPVEEGADVTDNIRNLPLTVTLTCVVSDSPIGRLATERAGLGVKPSEDARRFFQELRESRRPVTITTSLQQYQNMALTRLTIPRDTGSAGGLHFTASFTQVEIVSTERQTVEVEIPRLRRKQKRGAKASPDATSESTPKPAEKTERRRTIAQRIGGAIFN